MYSIRGESLNGGQNPLDTICLFIQTGSVALQRPCVFGSMPQNGKGGQTWQESQDGKDMCSLAQVKVEYVFFRSKK